MFFFFGIIVLMVIVALVTFFVGVQGKEKTLVPDLEGMELLEALPELQAKGLLATIWPKYDNDAPKHTVIYQKPVPGSVVKQGRVVELHVSKGAIIDRVPNYLGWRWDEVEQDLRAIFASYEPLLRMVDPIFEYADKPANTVIQQQPAPDSPLTGLTDLKLVVSRGPEGSAVVVGDYVGVDYLVAVSTLAGQEIPFVITLESSGEPGMIVSQSPEAESEGPYESAMVQLWLVAPDVGAGEAFGVFEHVIERYEVRVAVRLDLVVQEDVSTLFSMRYHPGGAITIPYIAPDGAELVLWVEDREVRRVRVEAPEEE